MPRSAPSPFHTLRCRVPPIRKKRKAEIAVLIRKNVDLEPFNLFFDLRANRQEGGDDNHRAQTRRHAFIRTVVTLWPQRS